MAKQRYRFGINYLKSCRVGIAVLQGERFYWITDGYARYLITDFDPMIGPASMKVKVWTK